MLGPFFRFQNSLQQNALGKISVADCGSIATGTQVIRDVARARTRIDSATSNAIGAGHSGGRGDLRIPGTHHGIKPVAKMDHVSFA
jgi:hypothetical protein